MGRRRIGGGHFKQTEYIFIKAQRFNPEQVK
jgi:hypothetical protein